MVQTRNTIQLKSPVETSAQRIDIDPPSCDVYAAIFLVGCYQE